MSVMHATTRALCALRRQNGLAGCEMNAEVAAKDVEPTELDFEEEAERSRCNLAEFEERRRLRELRKMEREHRRRCAPRLRMDGDDNEHGRDGGGDGGTNGLAGGGGGDGDIGSEGSRAAGDILARGAGLFGRLFRDRSKAETLGGDARPSEDQVSDPMGGYIRVLSFPSTSASSLISDMLQRALLSVALTLAHTRLRARAQTHMHAWRCLRDEASVAFSCDQYALLNS
eukprot:3176843-Pleurochrysis_carterae.AAC.3